MNNKEQALKDLNRMEGFLQTNAVMKQIFGPTWIGGFSQYLDYWQAQVNKVKLHLELKNFD